METCDMDGRLSVTFKTGEKFKESLINFSGAREFVRSEMIAYFGLKPSECDGRTDYEIRLMCDRVAQAVEIVSNKLGAVIATKGEVQAGDAALAKQNETEAAGADPWAGVGEATAEPAKSAEPEVDPRRVVLDTIESVTSVKDLHRLWSENKAMFEANPDVMAAYKVRGKALQVAA
ncbi:hypothetical protein OG474_29955 [Kribbella sp. NBC_01505]|uniref:hypothetical protein n=1 Tax=Kribbella sp. NBC_01505 TaxID=2903580 RepID=UPI003865AC2F